MLAAWFGITLWKRILGALVLGVIVGALWGPGAADIQFIGDLFIRLIRMVVIPLIFTTLAAGVISMGDPRKLGSIGLKAVLLYTATTAVAIVIALVLATLIQPGLGVDVLSGDPRDLKSATSLADQMMGIVPTNVFAALSDNGGVLSVIFFSIVTGVAVLTTGDKAQPVAKLIDSAAEVVLTITKGVMEVAPFGVFALIASVAGTKGVAALAEVLPLALTVVLGCLIHGIVTHGSLLAFILKLPPAQFFKGAVDAQVLAFSSSSSSATLPVTMAVARDNLGIKPSVTSSVLPLGATINMDGTAIYVGTVAIFVAQAMNIPLSFMDYIVIALTTTLVSVGSAGIPSASLFLLAAVLGTINVPEAQVGLIVGFLFPFDRPLDMCRTVINVTGDLSVATAVAKWEGELDESSYRADPVE